MHKLKAIIQKTYERVVMWRRTPAPIQGVLFSERMALHEVQTTEKNT